MRKLLIAAALIAALAPAGGALAHGDYQSSSPAADATVKKVPSEITVTLTEPPTKESKIVAKDPCGDNVAEDISVRNNDIIATVGAGHAGEWKVKWSSISAVDGHSTTGTFSFAVAGDTDCSEPEPEETEPAGSETPGQPGPSDDASDSDDGEGFPVVPVIFGGGALIALAAIVRFAGSR